MKERAKEMEKNFGDSILRPTTPISPSKFKVFGEVPKKGSVCILCGGGPAPGFNGVIAGITMKAMDLGYTVFGVLDGYEYIMMDPKEFDYRKHCKVLTIETVGSVYFHGGTIIGTSRANPKKTKEGVENCVKNLKKLGCVALFTIGGDDTCTSSININKKSLEMDKVYQQQKDKKEGYTFKITCIHVPKTIDNDLPLPPSSNTFGFSTARELGATLVKNLMYDASSTKGRYFVVISMGRNCGSLALGMSNSAGAQLCLIPEEFLIVDDIKEKLKNQKDDAFYDYFDYNKEIDMNEIKRIIEGMVIKRLYTGRTYGAIVIAEGVIFFLLDYIKNHVEKLIKTETFKTNDEKIKRERELTEKLLLEKLGTVANLEYDSHGHPNVTAFGKHFGAYICSEMKKYVKQMHERRTKIYDEFIKLDTFEKKKEYIKKLVCLEKIEKEKRTFDESKLIKDVEEIILNYNELPLAKNGKAQINFTEKELGYALRCAAPNSFDIEYTRNLGWEAVRLIGKTEGCMVTLESGKCKPIPFTEIRMDPQDPGHVSRRPTNIFGENFKCSLDYQRRLNRLDLENIPKMMKLALVGGYTYDKFVEKFEKDCRKFELFGL